MILGFLIFAKLLLYGLATFRMAVLISQDSGPAKIFSRFRSFLKREEKTHPALKKSDIAKGAECLKCSSVWVAFPVAAYATLRHYLMDWIVICGDIFVLAMSLSALAIIFSRAFPPR